MSHQPPISLDMLSAERLSGYDTFPKVAATPDGQHILRVFTPGDSSEPQVDELFTDVDRTLELIRTRDEHLAFLGGLGIHIPKYTTFIGPALVDKPKQPGIAVYDLVERIELQTDYRGLSHDDWRHRSPELGETLLGYCQWVEDNHLPLFMLDIFIDEEFGVDLEGNIALVDIDPRLTDPLYRDMEGTPYIIGSRTYAVSLLYD